MSIEIDTVSIQTEGFHTTVSPGNIAGYERLAEANSLGSRTHLFLPVGLKSVLQHCRTQERQFRILEHPRIIIHC